MTAVDGSTRLAGRYRIIDRLGTGGMATVFLAEDERLGRKVAIKRLHADSPDDAARRFQREAKVGASLSHPGLVTVFDTAADDEGVLIVMEYVPGETLAALMAREQVPPERAVAIVSMVAEALDHAHQAGVVHRDVKPANILVDPDGEAKLVDLGIARATERTQITSAGTVLGTPSYMAPEQLEGGTVTSAVDVYALGAVAYELLSGSKARRGRTPVEMAHLIATEPAPDLRDAWPGAPPAAAAILARAMARDPAERPASAGALARALEQAVTAPPPEPTVALPAVAPVPFHRGEPAAPPRTASAARLARTRAPRRALPPWVPVAGLVLVLLVVAGAIAALTSGGSHNFPAPVIPTTTSKAKPKSGARSPAHTTPAPTLSPNVQKGLDLHAKAHELIAEGRYDEAIDLERDATNRLKGTGRTEYWYALFDLGHALRLGGHPDQAIPVLQERLQFDNQRDVVQAELDQAFADLQGGKKGKRPKGPKEHGKKHEEKH